MIAARARASAAASMRPTARHRLGQVQLRPRSLVRDAQRIEPRDRGAEALRRVVAGGERRASLEPIRCRRQQRRRSERRLLAHRRHEVGREVPSSARGDSLRFGEQGVRAVHPPVPRPLDGPRPFELASLDQHAHEGGVGPSGEQRGGLGHRVEQPPRLGLLAASLMDHGGRTERMHGEVGRVIALVAEQLRDGGGLLERFVPSSGQPQGGGQPGCACGSRRSVPRPPITRSASAACRIASWYRPSSTSIQTPTE